MKQSNPTMHKNRRPVQSAIASTPTNTANDYMPSRQPPKKKMKMKKAPIKKHMKAESLAAMEKRIGTIC